MTQGEPGTGSGAGGDPALAPRPLADLEPFAELDQYLAIPRIAGLVLSPDGSRLVCPVQTLSNDRTKYVTALWEVDPENRRPPRRLTRSSSGESSPAFLPNGDLLFVSKRSDVVVEPGQPEPADDVAGVWVLPAAGGEARPLVFAASDITNVYVARDAGTVFVTAGVLPGPADGDAERRKARKEAGVTALLHETVPVRHWDHDLGPDQRRLFAVEAGTTPVTDRTAPVDDGTTSVTDGAAAMLRDLTPDPGRGLDEAGIAVSPDGAQVAIGWRTALGNGCEGRSLVVLDTATGNRRIVAEATRAGRGTPRHSFDEPAISPDRRYVVCVDEREATYDTGPTKTLWLVDIANGQGRDLTPDLAVWPAAPVFSADSRSVFFVADESGHAPVFRVDIDSGAVVRLTTDGAYTTLAVAPDGRHLYALRSHVDRPPTPVRLDVDVADQKPEELDAPGRLDALPGRLEDVRVTASDGVTVRGWLALPDQASTDNPVPLVLWVHGGPLMSWNSWSWRWNPWLLVAHGWAVLLPDPRLSQGYGDEFIQQAWGQWGPLPFSDLMAITDATIARPDIDEARTAAMGGSYGGYMANWIAGHTDRFKAIVSHAGLWTLEHFTGATDHPGAWEEEWGHPLERPQRYELNSPARHVSSIRTPMLVIHGDKDYRVPIGEALRLWSDLMCRGVEAKFLYFPDENHWVLKPGNAKVWYQTVFAFLDHHMTGAEWIRPELL